MASHNLTVDIVDLSADTEPADLSPVGAEMLGALRSARSTPLTLQPVNITSRIPAPPSCFALLTIASYFLPEPLHSGRKVKRQQQQQQMPRPALETMMDSHRDNGRQNPTR